MTPYEISSELIKKRTGDSYSYINEVINGNVSFLLTVSGRDEITAKAYTSRNFPQATEVNLWRIVGMYKYPCNVYYLDKHCKIKTPKELDALLRSILEGEALADFMAKYPDTQRHKTHYKDFADFAFSKGELVTVTDIVTGFELEKQGFRSDGLYWRGRIDDFEAKDMLHIASQITLNKLETIGMGDDYKNEVAKFKSKSPQKTALFYVSRQIGSFSTFILPCFVQGHLPPAFNGTASFVDVEVREH